MKIRMLQIQYLIHARLCNNGAPPTEFSKKQIDHEEKKSNNLIKVPDLHNGRSMAASERGAADGERGAHAHHRPATAGIRAAVQNLPSRWHFLRQLQQ